MKSQSLLTAKSATNFRKQRNMLILMYLLLADFAGALRALRLKKHLAADTVGYIVLFPVPNIATGIYIVSVRNQEGAMFNKKIVVR